jgi:hypothetical protein
VSDGRLTAADYWTDRPQILSAGFGFDNIIGIARISEETVREAGGSWNGMLYCPDGGEPPDAVRSSAATPDMVARAYKGFADHDDGLPVVFSWPLATETVDPTDFRLTLNTGERVFPHAAGMFPNWELNERNVVVLFGDFGNRGKGGEADAVYPVRLDIVTDATPLKLVGPAGEISGVGLSWEADSTPYDRGPTLVGAKLNRIAKAAEGEGGATLLEQAAYFPNDEFSLYGGGDFRLRLLTTGGFSPDGINAVTPDAFERHFRIHATGPSGETVIINKAAQDYALKGGRLQVVGLAELGRKANPAAGVHYDSCYVEDRDNYIDIILAGDEAAARGITHVEIPAAGPYLPFYNPGGPGPHPFQGVRYTAPGPSDLEPVIIALDDPMRIDRRR